LNNFHKNRPNAINIPFDKHMDNGYIQKKIDETIKKKFNEEYPKIPGAHRNNKLTIKFLPPEKSISFPMLRPTTSPSYDSDGTDGTDPLSDLSPDSTPRSRLSDGSSLSLPSIPSSSSSTRSTHSSSSGSTRGKIGPLMEIHPLIKQGFNKQKNPASAFPPIKQAKTPAEMEEEAKEAKFTKDLFEKRKPVLDEDGKPVVIGGGKSTHKRKRRRRTFKKAAKVPNTA
jgi:hypothetical protein